MVEGSRVKGSETRVLNGTFIALIPKCDNPSSYNEFRLISLQNVVYKIITKVIANKIKPILSLFVS